VKSITKLDSEGTQARSDAAVYEQLAVPALFAGWAASLVDLATPACGTRVLDVGCGTGIVARTVAARVGADLAIDAIDNDPAMLEVACTTSVSMTTPIAWRKGDANRLPFDDATFDVVFSQQALQFIDDPGAALAEMQRVVRPRGSVAVSTWRGVREQQAAQALGATFARHLGPEAAGEVDAQCVFGAPEVLARAVSDAGFKVVHAGVLVEKLHFHSAESLLELAALLTSLGPWLEGITGDGRRRLIDDLDRALGEPPLPIPVEACAAVGRR
jgi:2-polyprenyl-3-methyl-5-hydroxy-6-metoxy-1,4-benzoquinol methylase